MRDVWGQIIDLCMFWFLLLICFVAAVERDGDIGYSFYSPSSPNPGF
jgi:hypothetical protein